MNAEVQILHSTVDSIENEHIIFIPADALFYVTGFINGVRKENVQHQFNITWTTSDYQV